MRRGIGLAALALSLLWAAFGAAVAQAAPAVNGVFDLTGTPQRLAEGPDGNIWLTLSGSGAGNDIAKVTPAGVVTEYDVPAFNNPIGIASDGADLWVTQPAEVVKFSPANPAGATATGVADIAAGAQGITYATDGNLWTASGDKVIKIPPANPGTATSTTVAGLNARGTAAGNGLVWVADFGGRVVSVTPGGVATPYVTGGGIQEVAADPSIDKVAFSQQGSTPHEVGLLEAGGEPQLIPAPNTDPFGVAYGSDGAFWFAQFVSDNLGRLTTDGVYTTLGGLPAGGGPRYITAGPNNTLWVGLTTVNKVARVTGVDPPVDPPTVPETTIDKAPKTVEAGKKGAKAKFKFSSDTAGATFECALKRKGKRNKREKKLAKFAPCESPKKYKKLRKGRYKFKVRASAGGETDPTPAVAKLRVKG